MNNKERRIPRKKTPHGEAVHRRWVLAAARRAQVFDVDERIIDMNQARLHLAQIEELLSPDNQSLSTLSEQEQKQTRTGLEIKSIWLQFRLGIITSTKKQQLLTSKFDKLEKNDPDLYQWLVSRNEHGLSMAERIRDEVIPPIRVGGYHTKR